METTAVTRETIAATYELIRSHVRRTPVIEVDAADFGLSGRPIVFKLELLQHTGSFKPRGALASLLSRAGAGRGSRCGLRRQSRAGGGVRRSQVGCAGQDFCTQRVGGYEAGSDPRAGGGPRDFGRALCRCAGGEPGVRGGLGGDGDSCLRPGGDAARARDGGVGDRGAMRSACDRGRVASLRYRAMGLDTLLVAVGGGGLIGGMAAWFAGRVRLVAVEPRTAPTLYRAREAGRPVDAEAGGIAAESLAPRQVGQFMFPLAQQYVEQAVLVEDDAIREAQQALWRVMRVASEPGGAAAFAALLSGATGLRRGSVLGWFCVGAIRTR